MGAAAIPILIWCAFELPKELQWDPLYKHEKVCALFIRICSVLRSPLLPFLTMAPMRSFSLLALYALARSAYGAPANASSTNLATYSVYKDLSGQAFLDFFH